MRPVVPKKTTKAQMTFTFCVLLFCSIVIVAIIFFIFTHIMYSMENRDFLIVFVFAVLYILDLRDVIQNKAQ